MNQNSNEQIVEQAETISANADVSGAQVSVTGIGTDQIQKNELTEMSVAEVYKNQKAITKNAQEAVTDSAIAGVAKRMHEKSQKKAQASTLLNSLIKKVVKEQDAKSDSMRWEHLVNMHNQIGAYLLNLTSLAAFMRNKVLLNEVTDKPLMLRLVSALARDMATVQKRANANANEYPIKSGEIVSDEDMLKAIGIYEVYNQILIDIAENLMPISNQVFEMFTLAEHAVIAKEAIILAEQAAGLTDPKVISDVQAHAPTEEVPTEMAPVAEEVPAAPAA